MRALFVEDDPGIRSIVSDGLIADHYEVETAADGEEGLAKALANDYGLIILDLLLPSLGGLELLETVRQRGKRTPVIVLTARDSTAEKVRLLDAGADDYMTKPFSYSELSARIRALIRRSDVAANARLVMGELVLDPIARRASRAGIPIDLTGKEFTLLFLMMQNAGHVMTRRAIAECLWGDHFESISNVIDVHVNHLRMKVDQGFTPKMIHTVRGVGYTLRSDGGSAE